MDVPSSKLNPSLLNLQVTDGFYLRSEQLNKLVKFSKEIWLKCFKIFFFFTWVSISSDWMDDEKVSRSESFDIFGHNWGL